MPLIILILTLSVLISENLCNNMTGKYDSIPTEQFQTKTQRLLSFNTEQNGDISMELAFNVPFITIPVKKSVDVAKGAIANLNVGAVVLAGAIAFGFAVVIPGIVFLMSKKSRSEENHKWWEYLKLLDLILTENDIDTTSCMQRVICWTVKNSAQNVKNGKSSSGDKIIDGLATNEWIQMIVKGTIIHDAVKNGLGKTNCSKKYNQCKISQKSVQMLADTINNKKK